MTKILPKKSDIHTISMLVANKPGVLVRVALVFARRGYNIDALAVSPAYNPDYSRMTITAQGNPDILDQIIKQASKLVDVLHAEEHNDKDAVHRELALIKLKITSGQKPTIHKLIRKYGAHVVQESNDTVIVQQAGVTQELDEFETMMKKYGILEMVRSGKLVIAKGKEKT